MGASVDAIRKGFKDALDGITGLTAYATMPASPRLPCVAPLPFMWRYDVTMDPEDPVTTWTFRLWFYLPRDDLNKSQLAFDSYITAKGPNSVPQRLRDNPTLNGVVDDVVVLGGDQYLAEGPVGGVAMLGSYLSVEVFA
jgi:hypothetical protein